MVYKFLDKYIGEGISIIKRVENGPYNPYTLTRTEREFYDVKSDNGTLVLFFTPNSIGDVTIFPAYSVYTTVGGMFSLETEKSKQYLREWFREKNKIIHFRELLDYISPS